MRHQVIADKIEPIAVEPSPGGAVEPLPKLTIEIQIPQPLAFDDIFQRCGHPHTEELGSCKRIFAVVHQDSGRGHTRSVGRTKLHAYFRNVI